MALIIFGILFALWLSPWAIMLYDYLRGTHYLCKTFHWHNGDGAAHDFDGCSYHAICSKCKKEVMQDGQGNWF